jgi:hypothetical protein
MADTTTISRGTTIALLAFDIAFSIDLDIAERILASSPAPNPERPGLRHIRKAPPYFEYRPLPIRVTLPADPLSLGAFTTQPVVEALIFDFGAVSISYRVPLAGPLTGLLDLAVSLYDNKALADNAREHVKRLSTLLAPALTRPGSADAVEDYVIHQIEEVTGVADPASVYASHTPLIARILRAERGELSTEETAEAVQSRTSYRPTDAAIVDWNAAMLLDRDADDVRSVLEFANIEALELRVLDDRLDQILDDAYRLVAERKPRSLRFPISSADLRRIARLQMDSALLYEGVNNAIKLVGDQYLARVYRLAAARFHLPERDASIERKLSTIESIYSKLHDRLATIRLEILEWIVIILILISIVLPFLGWK